MEQRTSSKRLPLKVYGILIGGVWIELGIIYFLYRIILFHNLGYYTQFAYAIGALGLTCGIQYLLIAFIKKHMPVKKKDAQNS